MLQGFYETWDFFDSFTWYPLGRVVGGTMYPGAPRVPQLCLFQCCNLLLLLSMYVVDGCVGDQLAGSCRHASND